MTAGPGITRIDQLVGRAAAAHPDRTALVTGAGRCTFAELEARVDRLAVTLEAHVAPGDRVAVLARNRAEYAEAYLGVPRAGARLVPLHPRLHPDEWARLLERTRPAALLAEPDLLARLDGRVRRALGLRLVVEWPTTARVEPGPGPVPAPAHPGAVHPPAEPGRRDPQDVAWMIPTSGTTGPARLAMLTHRSLLAAVSATLAARPVGDDDVLATPFPLCHVAGYNLLVFWARARPVVLLPGFDPGEILRVVTAEGVTTLSLAPTMLAALLDHLDELDPRGVGAGPDRPLGPVRTVTYGASPIPPPLLRRAVTDLQVDLSQGYGMTELSGNAVFLGPDAHRAAAAGDDRLASAAGRPAPGVEVRIVDDTGRDVPTGATGEILVRAPQVMAGYWDDPEAGAAALDGGWLHTGDVGFLDDHGDLHVVDRRKDVIVTGGENVASREVEDVLATHPAVAEVAVVGLPDPRWGERVSAVVVPRGGLPPPTLAELDAHVRTRLAPFKVPRALFLVDALPRNHAGKVAKRALRERFGDR